MNGQMMTSRVVSAAFAFVLASAGATALAQNSSAPNLRPVAESGSGRLAPRYPAPPSYGTDAVASLRGDTLTTGSIAQRQRETRAH
ncbi:hypothetical protein ASG40_13170 [Methylobacterium sp. Leaf399]|nr:hypothetical protein [Methylobacterium sp. Leaf466]KQT07851.1 hypothetical protein ASG40_13170 [Methylobacterium sp. Leaf399]KQT88963.1 hypothetical protein ASG59_13935 [Methylobacterium sp. Leaf466]